MPARGHCDDVCPLPFRQLHREVTHSTGAPWTSRVIPGVIGTGWCTWPVKGDGTSWPRSIRYCQAVSTAMSAPAACTWSIPARLCARSEAGAATYSAYVRPSNPGNRRMPKTSSPTAHPGTSGATAWTTSGRGTGPTTQAMTVPRAPQPPPKARSPNRAEPTAAAPFQGGRTQGCAPGAIEAIVPSFLRDLPYPGEAGYGMEAHLGPALRVGTSGSASGTGQGTRSCRASNRRYGLCRDVPGPGLLHCPIDLADTGCTRPRPRPGLRGAGRGRGPAEHSADNGGMQWPSPRSASAQPPPTRRGGTEAAAPRNGSAARSNPT